MLKRIFLTLSLIFLPLIAFGQVTTHGGGTGLIDISSGSVPFGSIFNIRMATSSAFQFNNTFSRLTVTNASTTNLTATNATSTLSQYFSFIANAAGSFLATDSTGKLIATTSPQAVITGTAGQVVYMQNTNSPIGTSSIFINTTTGNVGVGNSATNAAVLLEVGTPGLPFSGTASLARFWNADAGVGISGQLQMMSNSPQGIDLGGSIGFGGNYKTNKSIDFASVSGRKENGTDDNNAGYLQFATRPNLGSPAERMRITSTGLVGVASSSPFATFAINPVADVASNQFVIGSSTGTSLLVNNSGNVLIGTTSVLTTGVPLVVQTTGVTLAQFITSTAPAVGSGSIIQLLEGGTPTAADQRLGALQIGGIQGATARGSTGLFAFSSNAWSATDFGSYLTFMTTAAGGVSRTEKMRLSDAGLLGIGTTTPWRLLSVGTGNVGTFAISTSTSGCATFSALGELYSTGSTCGGGSLTGTTGQTAYFSGTNTAIGTSTIFITTGSRVGIGTLTPVDVNANSMLTAANTGATDIIASTTDNTTLSTAIFEAYAPGSRVFMGAHGTNQVSSQYGITAGGWGEIGAINSTFGSSNGLMIGTRTTATPIVFGTNSIERMRILSGGNVGVGTTSPYAKFSINNSTNDAGGQPLFVIASSTPTATSTLFVVTNTGNVGLSTSTPGRRLEVAEPTTATVETHMVNAMTGYTVSDGVGLGYSVNDTAYLWNYENTALRFATNNTEQARFTNLGNFGLATTTPFGKLAISLNSNDTAYPGNNAFLIASSTSAATTTLFNVTNTGLTTVGNSILAPDKSCTNTSYGFTANPNTGMFEDSGSAIICDRGTREMLFRDGGVIMGTNNAFGWGNLVSFAADTIITRPVAGSFSFSAGQFQNSGGNLLAGRLGLGSTTPFALLDIVATSTTGTGALRTLFNVASTTGGTSTSTLFGIDNTGHIIGNIPVTGDTNRVPVLGTCGTATITATSTDVRGTIVVSAGTPTTCNLSFKQRYTDTPTCLVSDSNSALSAAINQASTTGIQFGLAAVFSGNIHYICMQ